MSSPADLAIDELLAELGFSGASAVAAARAVLDGARLTNPKKQRVAADKRTAISELLASELVRSCARDACRRASARSGRREVTVANAHDCEHCGGQENRAAFARALAALSDAAIVRVAIIGGSPATHAELERLIATSSVELRLIDGTERRTGTSARADLQWADLVVVWGATELDHKVSKLYTDARAAHVVVCNRRGVASLASTLEEAAQRRTRS